MHRKRKVLIGAMTNQSNPADQVSRYRSFTGWIKACILHRYTFLSPISSLLVGVALFGIRILPH